MGPSGLVMAPLIGTFRSSFHQRGSNPTGVSEFQTLRRVDDEPITGSNPRRDLHNEDPHSNDQLLTMSITISTYPDIHTDVPQQTYHHLGKGYTRLRWANFLGPCGLVG